MNTLKLPRVVFSSRISRRGRQLTVFIWLVVFFHVAAVTFMHRRVAPMYLPPHLTQNKTAFAFNCLTYVQLRSVSRCYHRNMSNVSCVGHRDVLNQATHCSSCLLPQRPACLSSPSCPFGPASALRDFNRSLQRPASFSYFGGRVIPLCFTVLPHAFVFSSHRSQWPRS